ncbi:hypothetical protein SAMN04489713_104254 [Actinomadura madurae]|uniref:Uncharacterized protein n=1 Tax=Actinomadura madurae TaxID=1993 RepID=A0A1I5ERV8_9ACTN|nr:hypothetical protein [Actinomadura madurae]SFO14244.1 hypothetical protein SAMN04489713_104254 [Actinomadura madurae]
MSDKPTHLIPDPSALTLAQRDGRACVACRIDVAPMRPVGIVDGVQVFACLSCDTGDQGDDEQPATGTIPGEWPNGEPDDVRDMARRRADLAQRADNLATMLEAEADGIRDVDFGLAVRRAAAAHRAFAAACRDGDDDEFDRTLREASEMIRRCVATVETADGE